MRSGVRLAKSDRRCAFGDRAALADLVPDEANIQIFDDRPSTDGQTFRDAIMRRRRPSHC
jgi:hypothetical protein